MKRQDAEIPNLKVNVATTSKSESSKTDRVMLSCFEFWAVKFGLGFGNSDLEL